MHELLLILTALVFYFLGRYSGAEEDQVRKIIRKGKKSLFPPMTGAIDFPTQDELDYEGSEQQKIDQDRVRAGKEAGILKLYKAAVAKRIKYFEDRGIMDKF